VVLATHTDVKPYFSARDSRVLPASRYVHFFLSIHTPRNVYIHRSWWNRMGPRIHGLFKIILANLNSRSRSLYAVARPSVVCLSVVGNARASYSTDCNFRQYFYRIWYDGHPLTFTKNFTEIVPGEPLRHGS